MSDKIELNNEQKILVLKRWQDETNIPSVSELVAIAWPLSNEDERSGRSKFGRCIKEFLVEKNIKYENIQSKDVKKDELSDEFKEYIINNCANMSPIEMARVLHNDIKLAPASKECRTISAFCKTVNPAIFYSSDSPENDYKAPNTPDRVVARIRRYVKEAEGWDFRKLTPTQKKQTEALIGYLHAFRFKHQIDSYETDAEKTLFESSFIKYTYNKEDLTQENIDQYILLCSEIVHEFNIQKTINMLQNEQDRVLNEDGRISMAVVEAIKTAGDERNQSIKTQQALYKSLTQERSDKLSEEIKDKASLLNLVDAWKRMESRQKIIKLAENEKEKIRKELHELEDLDEMKYRLLGISIDEVLNA